MNVPEITIVGKASRSPGKCDYCRKDIGNGPHKRVDIRFIGERSIRFFRHLDCPNWEQWEISPDLTSTLRRASRAALIDATDTESPAEFEQIVGELRDMVGQAVDQRLVTAERAAKMRRSDPRMILRLQTDVVALRMWHRLLIGWSPPPGAERAEWKAEALASLEGMVGPCPV